MQIESLPSFVSDAVEANDGLKSYLNGLYKGRPATPRSWLFEGQSDTEVLRNWLKVLNTLERKSPTDELVYQFDTSQLKKWGPQGEVKPITELMDVVTAGFKDASPRPRIFATHLWQQAKAQAIKILCMDTGLWHRLRPRALEHVVDDMRARDVLESNSGFPDFARRKDPKVKQAALAHARDGSWKDFPAIALFRNYNQKTRLVWMYPMSTNLIEGQFVQPLKEAIMNSTLQFFAPWRGYEHNLRLFTEFYDQGKFLSASDFSHTDEHFTKWQVLEVFDVIKHAFQEQYWDELKESMLRVVSIPLVIGNKWIRGDHGVSSGSNWTNDIETYMDFICEQYFILLGIVSDTCTAIGDDVSHVRAVYKRNLPDVMAHYYNEMGFDVNAEKVTNSPYYVKYLQRLSVRGWYSDKRSADLGVNGHLLRGVYSTVRALNSSLNPEKFHSPKLWNENMFAVRQFSILENCIDHPLFYEFVEFVCSGHPYLCKFAKKGDKFINEAQRQSHLVPGLNPTYNQEKRGKSMSSFYSIRIAREL